MKRSNEMTPTQNTKRKSSHSHSIIDPKKCKFKSDRVKSEANKNVNFTKKKVSFVHKQDQRPEPS